MPDALRNPFGWREGINHETKIRNKHKGAKSAEQNRTEYSEVSQLDSGDGGMPW
jgi:hypothetical protein